MKYLTNVRQGPEIEIEIDGDAVRVGGTEVEARLATIPGTDLHHLLIGAESHTVRVEKGARRGVWMVSLGGRVIEVEVQDERTRAIRALGGAAEVEAPKVVVAPMPGLVVRVEVEVGQRVAAGQGVIVVEAMKMENELKAPADGVVARLEVAPGQTVEKGSVLIVFE